MKKLYHSLSKVNALGIKTCEQLSQHKDLYAEVFLAIDHFISHTAFRSHVNINRLLELRKLGVDTEDVHYAALERCVDKLDLILKNEKPERMLPYTFIVINNICIDIYRKTIKERNTIVSLDETLDRHDLNDHSWKARTLEDCLADQKASAENLCIAKEEVLALFKKFSDNCDTLLIIIANRVFNESPRDIANVLVSQGSVSKAISVYQHELSEIYGIELDEFPYIAPEKKTGLAKLLFNSNNDAIAPRISNILYRTHKKEMTSK